MNKFCTILTIATVKYSFSPKMSAYTHYLVEVEQKAEKCSILLKTRGK